MERMNVSQVREWDDKDGNHHIERVDSKGLTKTVVKNKNKGIEKKEDWTENLESAFDKVTASVLYKQKEKLGARVLELEQELDKAREGEIEWILKNCSGGGNWRRIVNQRLSKLKNNK